MKLNRYDRRDSGGRRMGLLLAIKEDGKAISVAEVQLRKSDKK